MINDDAGANEPRSTTLALTLAGVLAVGSVIGIIANYQRLEKDSLYCRQSGAYSILIAPETHQPCLVARNSSALLSGRRAVSSIARKSYPQIIPSTII